MPPRRRQRARARPWWRRDGGRVEVAAGRLTPWRDRGPASRPRRCRFEVCACRLGTWGARGASTGPRRRRRRVQMAVCRLTAWRARGPSGGSRRPRPVGGLALLATARVGRGPLTRPGCRRAHRPGPDRRRARRQVDGGAHRGVRPPGIQGRSSGPTRRDVRTPWTVDIESREPLQPPRRPGGRFPRPPRRTIRPHPTGRRRFPVANRGIIRRASRVGGRCGGRLPAANGCAVLPAGGIRGRRGGRFGTANRCAIRPAGGAAGRGRWTRRRRRVAGVGGGPLRFRVACGGRRGPIAHGRAGSGRHRHRHRLGFPFAGGRRRLLGNRRFLGLLRHRPRLPAGRLRSWTVRSPPARPDGRARLTFDLGTRPIWFWAPVALLLGTWVGLPLRARVVLGVRRNGPLRPGRRRP
jgi:hypothetical protein